MHDPHNPYAPNDLNDPHGPNGAPPVQLTYPWRPQAPAPGSVRRRRSGAALGLGRHSDIRLLRTAYKWLRRVATATALGYFVLFLVLSAYAPELMTLRVDGGLSAGLLLGACQLPVTLVALAVYEGQAHRRVDPLSERLRRQAELADRR
ncbi:DUF485 domain-containing protein [Streptomyces boluensis]|uniref:DUF485 domain-containing protein n=1 Tax=Streptomyces boluensis TaxID=1775135 RepID=A0A964XQ79_9ACTN|nr:DUF485 domain-containing protein [Streptomyces boluensis]NBE56001.1 DUF485 domain-containing protein [Streptomyces boluensis]